MTALPAILLSAPLLLALAAPAPAQQSAIYGAWSTPQADSKVWLMPCGDDLCGEITALGEATDPAASPVRDSNNQEAALRSRPMLGLRVLEGFRPAAPGRWEDGSAYDPREGRTYNGVEIRLLSPDVLTIGVCLFWGAICRNETWTREGD